MNSSFISRYSKNGMKLSVIQRKAFNEFNEGVYFGDIKLNKIVKCFCGSQNLELLSRFDRFGLPFGTQICKECGLITQTIRIDEESMGLFYNNIYWPLILGKSKTIGFSTPPKVDETSPFIMKFIDNKIQKFNIFEIGCGSGDRISILFTSLKSAGAEVSAYGCDYSEDALEIAGKKGINVIKGGFEEIAAFGKADILIMSHLFEHLPDLHDSLEKIEKITHDNTLIYIELPGILDLPNKKEYMYNYQDYNVLAHTYNFSLGTLSFVLKSKGYGLLDGDEYIRSVFKKGINNKDNIDSKSNYDTIKDSLQLAYEKDLEYEKSRSNPLVNYFKRIVKAVLAKNN